MAEVMVQIGFLGMTAAKVDDNFLIKCQRQQQYRGCGAAGEQSLLYQDVSGKELYLKDENKEKRGLEWTNFVKKDSNNT